MCLLQTVWWPRGVECVIDWEVLILMFLNYPKQGEGGEEGREEKEGGGERERERERKREIKIDSVLIGSRKTISALWGLLKKEMILRSWSISMTQTLLHSAWKLMNKVPGQYSGLSEQREQVTHEWPAPPSYTAPLVLGPPKPISWSSRYWKRSAMAP